MPVVPASPPAVVAVTSSKGVASSPCDVMTRNLPGCSVKNNRPSGANASDQGTVSPVATSSVTKSLSVAGGGGGGVGVGVGVGVGLVGEFGGPGAGFELVVDVLPQPT